MRVGSCLCFSIVCGVLGLTGVCKLGDLRFCTQSIDLSVPRALTYQLTTLHLRLSCKGTTDNSNSDMHMACIAVCICRCMGSLNCSNEIAILLTGGQSDDNSISMPPQRTKATISSIRSCTAMAVRAQVPYLEHDCCQKTGCSCHGQDGMKRLPAGTTGIPSRLNEHASLIGILGHCSTQGLLD